MFLKSPHPYYSYGFLDAFVCKVIFTHLWDTFCSSLFRWLRCIPSALTSSRPLWECKWIYTLTSKNTFLICCLALPNSTFWSRSELITTPISPPFPHNVTCIVKILNIFMTVIKLAARKPDTEKGIFHVFLGIFL